MKDSRMERLVLLPFSVGCISQSCVAVGADTQLQPQPRRSSKPNTNPSLETRTTEEEEDDDDDEESLSSGDQSPKNSSRFLALQKPNISSGFLKLCKNLKNFSQSFGDKDEMEEAEMDIEIGIPTDVKHVTHIGWDGSATNNPIKGWDNLMPPELLSLPHASFRQLELSMGTQPDRAPLGSCPSFY